MSCAHTHNCPLIHYAIHPPFVTVKASSLFRELFSFSKRKWAFFFFQKEMSFFLFPRGNGDVFPRENENEMFYGDLPSCLFSIHCLWPFRRVATWYLTVLMQKQGQKQKEHHLIHYAIHPPSVTVKASPLPREIFPRGSGDAFFRRSPQLPGDAYLRRSVLPFRREGFRS